MDRGRGNSDRRNGCRRNKDRSRTGSCSMEPVGSGTCRQHQQKKEVLKEKNRKKALETVRVEASTELVVLPKAVRRAEPTPRRSVAGVGVATTTGATAKEVDE